MVEASNVYPASYRDSTSKKYRSNAVCCDVLTRLVQDDQMATILCVGVTPVLCYFKYVFFSVPARMFKIVHFPIESPHAFDQGKNT